MEKNNFILYKDWKALIDKLSDEQAGKLFKGIYTYVCNGETPADLDSTTEMLFMIIQSTLLNDLDKYRKKCEKNKKNIDIRWDTKNTNVYERIPKNTNVQVGKNKNTKNTDNEYDYDNEYDNDIYLKKKNIIKKKKFGEYGNVTLSEKEYSKLATDYPIEELITILDEAKEQHGYKYKSDYLAIKNWVIKEYESRHKDVSTANNNVCTAKQDIVVNYSDSGNKPLSDNELEALKEFRNG